MSLSSSHNPMKLFSDPWSHYSHRVRLALAEKEIKVDISSVDDPSKDEDLMVINPSLVLPTLQDRGTVLNNSSVIIEYLDERYPHPPLFPIFPVEKARSRSIMREIDEHLSSLVDVLSTGANPNTKQKEKARDLLKRNLVAFQAHYLMQDDYYFGGAEFSLVDCTIMPILWRLELLGVELPDKTTRDLQKYMNRVFGKSGREGKDGEGRQAFWLSLSEEEKEMPRRKA